jgi:cold shock CspA family protein
MRFDGILRTWNDDRGFGFIAPTRGGAEVFVHVSGFARDGSRPVAGETVSFELGRGKDGKPQAVNVRRAAIGTPPAPARRPAATARPGRRGGGVLGWLLSAALLSGAVLAVAYWGYSRFQADQQRRLLEQQPAVAVPRDAAMPTSTRFRCDGRTHCSQMSSCAEATWFINHCPGTTMDGNHDGVPCEQQWCTHPGAP